MRRIYKFSTSIALALLLGFSTVQAQSQELPLGSPLPSQNLSLSLAGGGSTSIGALAGSSGTVFIFWSNQCPWVDKYTDRILNLYNTFSGQGINFVVVNSNDASAFPQESAAQGQQQNLPMPYVIDAGSQFANAIGASRTPHIFLFDADQTLVYIGTIDDSPGDPANVTKTYLNDALQALGAGSPVAQAKTKAFGCMIKFKQ